MQSADPATDILPATLSYVLPPTARPSTWRRLWPALALFVLSPWIAEFLLGNLSVTALPALLVLAPLYGGGAILVREVARRAGRGWPTILLLALAYGIVEEGFVVQTLFNPNAYGLRLLDEAYIPLLGIGAWWTLFVLTIHTVWSIAVPIALVEALVPVRAQRPWLGNLGLTVVAVLFALGCGVNFAFDHHMQHFMATPAQRVGASVAILAILFAAFQFPRQRRLNDCAAISPWLVGAFALVASSAFMALRVILHGWPIVMAYGLLLAAVIAIVRAWSRPRAWSHVHRLALAGGALLTYAWYGFVQHPTFGAPGPVALVGNAVFATMAVALLVLAARRVTRAHRPLLSPA